MRYRSRCRPRQHDCLRVAEECPAGELYPDWMSDGYRVAVVGATGQVGGLMLRLLDERGFPAAEVVPFASARSVGRTATVPWRQLTVRELDAESLPGFDVALFSAGRPPRGGWRRVAGRPAPW